jgi:hypothetical protein
MGAIALERVPLFVGRSHDFRLNGNCRTKLWPPAKRKIGERTVEERDSEVMSLDP